MKFLHSFTTALTALSCGLQVALAQQATVVTEPNTGFSFLTITTEETTGGFTWGYALPPGAMTSPATEYIGYVVGPINSPGPSWSGISHGMGGMPNSLLLMWWPYENEILSSFRWAAGYVAPDLYTGNATLTQIYSNVNDTYYTLVYRCQNCWAWDQDGNIGSQPTNDGETTLISWANAYSGLGDPSSVDTPVLQEHDSFDIFPFGQPSLAVAASYSQWATKTVGGASSTAKPTGSSTKVSTTAKPTTTLSTVVSSSTVASSSTAVVSGLPVPTETYDYIIVGAGAAGIPLGDKLSQAGHSVLLIERGPPSSYRWGGRDAPSWLSSTNATRFDVPGLDNEIWENSAGIACADEDQMEGCVLGGGTAVNAGLWWHVPDIDWNYNFPTGWQASDTAAATTRVFERIPGTYIPSINNELYGNWGYELIGGALAAAGWQNVTANSVPNSKNMTFSHPPWMYSHGERGGPMATYLVTASARSNFKLIMNTDVHRVIRTAGHATGVQVEAYADGGYTGVFNVTPTTGRVILSAGTFGSARILLRSGIGPTDQLDIVANSTDGPTMVPQKAWIDLPVGYNLIDHCNTDTVIQNPSVQFYDYYAAYDTPIASDASLYINDRSGMLAQSAPNIAPIFWDEIECSDGITRQLQWTARCEGSLGAADNYSMTMSQYLGRGSTSRGRMTMDSNFNTVVSELPYLQTAGDIEAVVKGIAHLQEALNPVKNLTWLSPTAGQDPSAYVSAYPITASGRRANHWLGTAKIGTDDGRSGGTAVVDTNTKVYGMDNLFVVDGSIFPGMMSTNPSAMIVTAAEHATDLLNALAPTSTVAKYQQCWSATWDQSSACAAGSTCTYQNEYYWQCL